MPAATPTVPAIRPRSAWAGADRPAGPLQEEAPGDVRFLLVHHSVNDNDYAAGDVVGMLRSIYDAHTGEKGWPDVAYNFFVDRHGGVWEGRSGSLDRPVRGDATGGSQGFALLCCFLGDHRTSPPTDAASAAMVDLLARLALQYAIPMAAGATATFTSRGSNLHPPGATVTTPTISAHRDMSATECPGEAGYAFVTGPLRAAVAARTSTTTSSTTTAPASTTTTTASTTTAPASTSTTTAPAPVSTAGSPTAPPSTSTASSPQPARTSTSTGDDRRVPLTGATIVAAGLGALLALRRRRLRPPSGRKP